MRYPPIHLLFLLVCMTPATLLSYQVAETAVSPADPPYVIQANDLLQVFIYDEPELSGRFLVRPDGQISVPLIQDLQAAGRTPAELKQQIEEGLQQYIDFPNVTVIVEAIQSYRVFVTGQVRGARALTSEKPITVLQALAMAGGFEEFASRNDTVIIREDGTRFRFEYDKVIKGENFAQNLLLKSGDVVIVP